MSSRVQKGNTVFKPVVKSRARTVVPSVSRQESVVLDPFAESLPVRKPPSLSPRPEQPPIAVTPSPAASTTNDERPLSESQATESIPNTIPAVISSRIPPPVLISPRPSTYVQSAFSIDALTEPPLPEHLTTQPTNVNQNTVKVPSAGIPGSSTLFIPMTPSPPPSPTLEEGPSTIHEGANMTRKNDHSENPKVSKKRKTSNRGEGKTSERGRSPSEPRSSKTPRSRRRAPSVPPFDPEADPTEDIDPTAVTMASLCVDVGQGRMSSKTAEIVNNHAAWKVKNREKRTRMRAIMEARKYGRPDDEAEDPPDKQNRDEVLQPPTPAVIASSSTAIGDDTGNGFDYSQDLITSRYNVQVRIGPNGETFIDEDSLVVDRAENQGTENLTHVTESDYTKFVNSATYGKRFRGSRWSAEETELFYDALSQYGENYELIAYVLPGRDRKACKNKFKAEDKKNPARINYCLNNRVPVDISTLSRMTGKDFSGPVPEIRAPPQPQAAVTVEDGRVENATSNEGSSGNIKKRIRSQNQVISDGDVVVIGDADDLQTS